MHTSFLDFSIGNTPTIKSVPKITGIHPLGSNILVELLNAQELTSSQIIVSDDASTTGPPQAYVLEVGPSVNCPHVQGLVGKRVILEGRGVTVPDFDGHDRLRLLVEYNVVKAILDEQEFESLIVS